MRHRERKRYWLVAALLVLTVVSVLGSLQAEVKSNVNWSENLEKALSQSKTTGKPVFVDVHADWCGWCKKLEREVFPQTRVAQLLNERFVPVRVDSDKNPDFAAKYDITGLPTLLVLEADGTEAGRIGGYMDAEPFAERLGQILKGREELARLEAAVEAEPNSAPANYALGMLAWDMDHYQNTVKYLGKAIQLDPELKMIDGEQALFALAQAHAMTGDLAQGIRMLERLMRTYPDSKKMYETRFLYGAMLYRQGRMEEAKQSLQLIVGAPEGRVPNELRSQAEHILNRLQ